MKTIEKVTEEKWFKSKPFLVVGTGDSLKFWNESLIDKFNIWTINNAIEVTKYADIAAMHDENPYNDLYRKHKTVLADDLDFSSRYILTRSENLRDNNLTNTIYVHLECDRTIPFGRVYPCQNSASLPFCIFHYYYPHDVYTLGINDGQKICDLINPKYHKRNEGENMKAKNDGMKHWASNYRYYKLHP